VAHDPDLLETLVTLVDTMVDEYDIVEFLHGLTERCVALLNVSEAGIMLADPTGKLRYAASSNEKMRLVELFELQIDEGPCVDAYRDGEPVVSSSAKEADRRWPEFGPHAREAGFPSIAAVPMRLRANTIGALNLFSSTSTPLSDQDLRLAQIMADVATIGILHERALRDAETLSGQLGVALESRVVIEQAKGIIAEHLQVGVDEAFELLRSFARKQSRRLSQTAIEIVDGTLRPQELRNTN
jgi:GAF domain-containing protein